MAEWTLEIINRFGNIYTTNTKFLKLDTQFINLIQNLECDSCIFGAHVNRM